MTKILTISRVLRVGLSTSLVALAGCASTAMAPLLSTDDADTPTTLREVATDLAEPEPTNQLYSAEWRDGRLVRSSVSSAPAAIARMDAVFEPKATPAVVVATTPVKIDTLLETELANIKTSSATSPQVELVVTYRETLKIPRFPTPIAGEPRDSAGNQAVAQRTAQLIGQIEQARAAEHAAHAAELAARYGARVKETFWLINAMVVQLPLAQVPALASEPEVQFVEHTQKPTPPPAGNALEARILMNTDPYFNLNLTVGAIGLLDTGVRLTHTLLSHVAISRDCVNGTTNFCSTGVGLNPSDDFWNHGTSSASELIANTNLGNTNRGITAISVDSWKVYNNIGFITDAGLRGFQGALAASDRVIVAEIQDPTAGDTGAISSAADAAFNTGAIVVAAAGNFGNAPGTVAAPGNAHKALAIGAVDVTSKVLQTFSGRGPTIDGRIKPDLLGPTNVNAASNASDTAMQVFTGTSAATPNAAGAAALMWEFFNRPAPGFINAVMIMTGQNFISPASDNNNGAGIPFLPVSGLISTASVTLSPGATIDVPISVTGVIKSFDAAIWWPETPSLHNDVDLQLVNPNNVVVASSSSGGSIFEKVRATTGLLIGTWKIRIQAFNVTGSQTVFWAFFQQM